MTLRLPHKARALPHKARALLAGLALLTACGAARADRSRLADESDVAEAGDCEVEAAFERRRVRNEAPERQSSLQLACGVGGRTELMADFTRRRGHGATGEAIGLEAKTSLRDAVRGGVGWAVVYGAGSERDGAGPWRRSDFFAAVEATWRPSPGWLVEARIGTARDRLSRSDSTLWELAAEHSATEAIELRAELSGDDRNRPLVGLALRWNLWPDRAQLKVSGGARGGPQRERRLGLGLTFEF